MTKDRLRIFFQRKSDGLVREIGVTDTLEEATERVEQVEDSFQEWERRGFPKSPQDSLLPDYEGSEVFAQEIARPDVFWHFNADWERCAAPTPWTELSCLLTVFGANSDGDQI